MLRKITLLALLALLVCCFSSSADTPGRAEDRQAHVSGRGASSTDSNLTVHEWGTFTSIAGVDGQAVEWSPLTGSTDLPAFVEHFRDPGFKLGLRGTVRMETPVLYFYTSREENVSVSVAFSRGVLTEWYPHASRVEPEGKFFGETLQSGASGSITWDSISLTPSARSAFPEGNHNNHYFAARLTSSTPLRVMTAAGSQQEKFLFYRGVAAFPVPLSVTIEREGRLSVRNNDGREIPATILFERRGDKVGYRLGGPLQDVATFNPPELNSSVDDLGRDLEGILVGQGLYQDEARAMVETWKKSWFEEGSRLLYLVPPAFVSEVLPLTIKPSPAQVERVFVGRLELVTPAMEKEVETALASHDTEMLKVYGRFLEPILVTMIKRQKDPSRAAWLQSQLGAMFGRLVQQNLHRN